MFIKLDWWMIIKNSFPVLLRLWPLWALIIIVAIISLIPDWMALVIRNWRNRCKFKKGEGWRSDRGLLRFLRGMKPNEFEDYIATLFQKLGYTIVITGGPHDKGVDVIAERNGIKHYIQCKKFITSIVSVSDVRDFYGAIADHLAHGKAYFITTTKFTLDAEKFCEDKPIELIDDFKLLDYIHLVDKKNEQTETAQNANSVQEKCPRCNGQLIKRQGKYGDFYGCSNYPRCRFTKKF